MRNLNVLLSLGIIFFHAACGGDVVIDREGQGGSDTSDAGPSDACQFNCSKRTQVGCEDDEAACVANCQARLTNMGQCASIYDEALLCFGENQAPPPDCNTPSPKCAEKVVTVQTCVASAPCGVGGQCEMSGSHCNCQKDCGGAHLESDCKFELDGTKTCTCRFNGEVVGSCTPTVDSCSVLSGCCAAAFAASH